MFYQCHRCKKNWQYPIEKCPECFLELEKLPSKEIKVIGVSKVNIPTIFHQKVPYFVLVLEDENGNKWVQKSIREYRAGDEFKIELTQDEDAVAIWRIKYDILEAIEKIVDLIGGIDINEKLSPIKQGEARDEAKPQRSPKVLILPTLVSPSHPHFAENTTPQFLEATIKYLIEKGVKSENIKVVGQSFDEIPIEASAQKSQLLGVCQNYKILPQDLAKADFIKKDEFEISAEVFNVDLIINLPILKLDSSLGVKGAVENTFKFLKKSSYFSLQRLPRTEEKVKKLQKILPGYLTIAEGNYIQTTSGFISFLGITLASFNPLNLDRVFAEICQTEPLPEWLKGVKIESIPIVGRRVEEVRLKIF